MSHEISKQWTESDILDWRDTFLTRLDRDLTKAFPELAERLKEAAERKWWLLLTDKKRFAVEFVRPEVRSWAERHVNPILRDAQASGIELEIALEEELEDQLPRMGRLLDAAISFLALAGVIICLFFGFTLMTTVSVWWWIRDWPEPNIEGRAVAFLLAMGFFAVLCTAICLTPRRLLKRFSKEYLPKLRVALVGDSAEAGEEKVSLKEGLKRDFRRVAEQLKN